MGYSAKYATIICAAFFAWTFVALASGSAGLREEAWFVSQRPQGEFTARILAGGYSPL